MVGFLIFLGYNDFYKVPHNSLIDELFY
jgi:hypothetical protein